jgi:hypothetical protein
VPTLELCPIHRPADQRLSRQHLPAPWTDAKLNVSFLALWRNQVVDSCQHAHSFMWERTTSVSALTERRGGGWGGVLEADGRHDATSKDNDVLFVGKETWRHGARKGGDIDARAWWKTRIESCTERHI